MVRQYNMSNKYKLYSNIIVEMHIVIWYNHKRRGCLQNNNKIKNEVFIMANISVFDFVNLCNENRTLFVTLYSIDKADVVWGGNACDIPSEYRKAIVQSFDSPCSMNSIVINID